MAEHTAVNNVAVPRFECSLVPINAWCVQVKRWRDIQMQATPAMVFLEIAFLRERAFAHLTANRQR